MPEPAAPTAVPPALAGVLAVSIDKLSEITSFGRTFIYAEAAAGRLRLTRKGRRTVVFVEDAINWLRATTA